MIGGVNMKKRILILFISSFVFFLCLGKNVYADSVTYQMGVGNTTSYNAHHIDDCTPTEKGIAKYEIINGSLKISIVGSPSTGSSDKFTCTYTDSDGMSSPKKGEITFHIDVVDNKIHRINLGLTSSGYEPSRNIANIILPSGATITSYKVEPDGSEYISVSGCSGTSCTVSMTAEAEAIATNGTSVSSQMKVKYKLDNKEYEASVVLIINAVTGARAYAGGVGVCDFSSDWTYRTWTDSAGKLYSFYQSSSESAVLPNCDTSNSKIPMEFKGWKQTSSTDHVLAAGQCSGALPAGSTVQGGVDYSACFERAPYVQISPATGNVDVGSEWQALKGNSGYYYSSTSASSVALPELIFTGIHKNDEVDYWYNSVTGEHKNSGDSVELDGSIWIAVIKTTVSEGWKDLYKTVKVDQTVALVVDGITGCSSSSSYVNVSFVSGECQVSGKEATPDETYADVVVTANGSEVIYKFNVEKVDAANIIVDDTIQTNLGTNSEITNKQEWYSENCSTFKITGGNSFTPYSTDGRTGTVYNVTEACGVSGNQGYYAFCLDPGRRAPTGDTYHRTKDLDGNEKMRRLVNVFLSKYDDFSMLSSLTDTTRIAFHIAIRAVAIESGATLAGQGGNDMVYAANYQFYANLATHINSPDLESYIKNDMHLVSDDIANKLYDLLYSYLNADDIEVETFERTVTSTETVSLGENGYKITYKGLIIAPSSVTAVTGLTPGNCGTYGVECDATIEENTDQSTILQYGNKKVYNYTVTITAGNASSVKPPTTEEEKKDAAFKVEYTGRFVSSDVTIAAPDSGNSLQRMFVFNTEQSDVLVYFSIVPTTCDFGALDYKKYCNADGCSNEFNADLFMAAGCCKLVTDETKYKYIIDNYCSGDGCTVSTMSSVCGLNSDNPGSAELYEIREGAKWENGGYVDQIGTCIVNVTQNYSSGNKDAFMKEDSAGNSLNVSSYSSNRYCQVSCGEDWKISLESFGNFVGINAVAAGTYFSTTNSDIFISGSRTCYTTYIDYDQYMKDLVLESDKAITAYNTYSEASHTYSDVEQQTNSNVSIDTKKNVCVKLPAASDVCSGCSLESVDSDTGYGTYRVTGSYDEYENEKSTRLDACSSNWDGETNGGCYKDYKNRCDVEGSYVEYSIKNAGKVESGQYEYYTNVDKGTSNSASKGKDSYFDEGEQFVCEFTAASVAGGEASIKCSTKGYSKRETGTLGGIEGTSANTDGTSSEAAICEKKLSGYEDFCIKGDVGNREDALERLKNDVQNVAQAIMKVQSGNMAEAVTNIHSYSENMYNCQHFELYNTADDKKVDKDGNKYANNESSKGTFLNHNNVEYVQIYTAFDPHVTYTYDEPEFMTIVGKDNILVEYDEKNNEVWGGTYSQATNESKDSQVNAYESRNNTVPVDSSEVQLSRNDISTYYYDTTGKFTGDDVNTYGGDSGSESSTEVSKDLVFCNVGSSRTYSPALNGYEWNGGFCYTMPIKYLKAHYVKSSISNSSFYKNKGYWYSSAGDLKEHGDTKREALENANKRQSGTYNVDEEIRNNKWWPFGTDIREAGINVFPVSLDTPRNLYLYSYEFGDIGSYSDNSSHLTNDVILGRLMGDETSLIQLNTRTCFYEVYEELCLCCGSEINSYVENSNTVNDYIETHPDIHYNPSDSDKMTINDNGVISFATSSVNLGDLDSDSNKLLGNNWGTSKFLYSGNLYDTTKGGELLKAIQSEGENVYVDNVEYSYHLTPSTITAIREYNDQYGYEVNYNNLKVYGSYAVRSLCDGSLDGSSSCWEVDGDDEYISFQHYGSTFLEEFMKEQGAVYTGTLTDKNVNSTCYVTSSDLGNHNVIDDKVKNGCRWVDYIQEADGKYFRLAFK